MPVVDTGVSSRRSTGVYAALLTEVDADIESYIGSVSSPPAVLLRARELLLAHQPVAVPAYLLPQWLRPVLRAGDPTPIAEVAVDGEIVLRDETPAETLAWLGL
jgi:hypothetical protein